MTENTTTEPDAGSEFLRTLGCGFAVLVGLPLLVVIAFVGRLMWNASGSTDYPRAAPEETAARVFQRSQEAYDVLGFRRTVEPGVEKVGVSPENTLDSSYCYSGGPLGLDDKTVDGAYSMNHSWALDHVTAKQAVPALRRLHKHLEDTGWTVTSYREAVSGDMWELFVQRNDGEERMSFTWYADRGYFTGGASGPCAYDPGWKDGDGLSGEDERPPALGPSRRG
ncbi:hypothetical protein ACWCP6_07300 [Streptomyces sp. NPDC002004]